MSMSMAFNAAACNVRHVCLQPRCSQIADRLDPSVNMNSHAAASHVMRPLHAAVSWMRKVIFRATLSLGCMEFAQSLAVTASDVWLSKALQRVVADYQTICLIYQFYEQRHLLFYTYTRSIIIAGHGSVIAVKNRYMYLKVGIAEIYEAALSCFIAHINNVNPYLCSVLQSECSFHTNIMII